MIDFEKSLVFKTKYGYKVISIEADVEKIYLEVTTRCNFDCTTCIRNSWQDEIAHMDDSVFELLLKQFSDLPNLEVIHLGGFGEPMSHPQIFEIIRRIKALGMKVEMITNGSLLTEDAINKLIEIGLDTLFVSLDGPEEQIYNTIRKGADFVSVIDHIKALNRIKSERRSVTPRLGIEFVLMKSNVHKLGDMAKLISKLNASQFVVTNILPYNKEMKDEIVYDLEENASVFEKSGLLSMRAKMPNMKLRTERYCNFVESKALAVTWAGEVAPCYALMHRYQCYIYGREKQIYPKYYGNIREASIKNIWMSKPFALFRASVNDFAFPSCTDCEYLEGCNYTEDNQADCWANSPSCAECLWARRIIQCP